MESKPTLTGRCPSCHRQATFVYVGPQYGHENGVLYFYNCSECGSTVSGRLVERDDKLVGLAVVLLVLVVVILAILVATGGVR